MNSALLGDLVIRTAPYALRELDHEIERAAKAVERTSDARRRLSAGSSRARVTSANARWARACEHHDRLQRLRDELRDAVKECRGG